MNQISGTHSRFCDVLAVPGLQDGAYEGLDASHLAHDHLVAHVVAGQVGDDAGGTGHHVDVVG